MVFNEKTKTLSVSNFPNLAVEIMSIFDRHKDTHNLQYGEVRCGYCGEGMQVLDYTEVPIEDSKDFIIRNPYAYSKYMLMKFNDNTHGCRYIKLKYNTCGCCDPVKTYEYSASYIPSIKNKISDLENINLMLEMDSSDALWSNEYMLKVKRILHINTIGNSFIKIKDISANEAFRRLKINLIS